MNSNDDFKFMKEAEAEARLGLKEGGIPIGSILVRGGKIVGRGHNQRVQKGSAILHGEMDCLMNAGRQKSYRDTVIYSTLCPCFMCSGTIVQFKIPRVVAAETTPCKTALRPGQSPPLVRTPIRFDATFRV